MAKGRALPSPVQLIRPRRHGDARGWFTEVYNRDTFAALGIDQVFVQDNHSLSVPAFTLRGLHFQVPPRGQDKLVRCVRGRIFDVAVDIRTGSPTFGQHVSAVLTAEQGDQLWVPPGFAHGYCTIEPDSMIAYKVTDFYSAADDGGIAWDDPALGIAWPVEPGAALLSDKDTRQPKLADLPSVFTYEAHR